MISRWLKVVALQGLLLTTSAAGYKEHYRRNNLAGHVYLYDFKQPQQGVRQLKIVSTHHLDRGTFAPHGISVWEDKITGRWKHVNKGKCKQSCGCKDIKVRIKAVIRLWRQSKTFKNYIYLRLQSRRTLQKISLFPSSLYYHLVDVYKNRNIHGRMNYVLTLSTSTTL